MLEFIYAAALLFLLMYWIISAPKPSTNIEKIAKAMKDIGEKRTWTTCKCSGCKSAWHSGEIQKEIEQATNRLDKETEKLY